VRKSLKYIYIFLVFALVACGAPIEPSTSSGTGITVSPVKEGRLEIGNMVYLPLDLSGGLDSNIGIVMTVVKDWEEENPDLQIVDLDIVQDQRAYSTGAYTYGVWIYFTVK
jgi:hypothetical protein